MYRAKIFVGSTIISVILAILLGIVISNCCLLFVFESYDKEISMAEELVFDDQRIIELYGEPIILSKGMKGRIVDIIDCHGDTMGYENINVHFVVGDGKPVSAVISFDRAIDSTVLVLNEGIIDVRPIFDISKIESSQTILLEYKNSRERYLKTTQTIRVIGTTVSLVVAMGLSVIYTKKYRYLVKNENNDRPILVSVIIIDIVFFILLLLGMYFLFKEK